MALITDQDLKHMKDFSAKKKTHIMQHIMSKLPAKEFSFEGNDTCGKIVPRLRADGLGLIDLQPQETAVTTVWYMKKTSYLGFLKSEVAALVLSEFKSNDEDVTMVRLWRI